MTICLHNNNMLFINFMIRGDCTVCIPIPMCVGKLIVLLWFLYYKL